MEFQGESALLYSPIGETGEWLCVVKNEESTELHFIRHDAHGTTDPVQGQGQADPVQGQADPIQGQTGPVQVDPIQGQTGTGQGQPVQGQGQAGTGQVDPIQEQPSQVQGQGQAVENAMKCMDCNVLFPGESFAFTTTQCTSPVNDSVRTVLYEFSQNQKRIGLFFSFRSMKVGKILMEILTGAGIECVLEGEPGREGGSTGRSIIREFLLSGHYQ